ncbi:hypothetical protein K493DRAFT_360056 [Basidiobolus meristosporus CBS 931.73]|uniref:Uncharacterized protein n=1 Tax=Basidiobolus meristosporus CBS 931.73 TaxID=1314790 RepID=A0A1Y1XMQ0_9FUNG|nr:hypothetical protein K493DRAFT_360056 [Basidiobolus meristosporus CBS 931.73]|eukprot:ORX86786.1 hypothetical protein K493DRAFT_360056 [Basidiobolus meristosporus CBS 931.73]
MTLDKSSQPFDRTRDSVLFSAFDLNTAYFASQENSKSSEVAHFSDSPGDMLRKNRQKRSPENLKIASTPEQYELMMHQHQARRELHNTSEQQRKRSLESQLYYHQQTYTRMEPNGRTQEFRERANSLPGHNGSCSQYNPASSKAASYSSSLLSPMPGTVPGSEVTPLTPVTGASMPEQIHNYMHSYNSIISHGLHTPSDIGDGNRSIGQPPLVATSTRRNSCPPEFMAAFVGMNYLDEEKTQLATIVEDETNSGYHQVATSGVNPRTNSEYQSQPKYANGMTVASGMEYSRLQYRRLSEPRLNKLIYSIEEHPHSQGSISVDPGAAFVHGRGYMTK